MNEIHDEHHDPEDDVIESYGDVGTNSTNPLNILMQEEEAMTEAKTPRKPRKTPAKKKLTTRPAITDTEPEERRPEPEEVQHPLVPKIKGLVEEINTGASRIRKLQKQFKDTEQRIKGLGSLNKLIGTLSAEQREQMDELITIRQSLADALEDQETLVKQRQTQVDQWRTTVEAARITAQAEVYASNMSPGFDPGDDPITYGRIFSSIYTTLLYNLIYLEDTVSRNRDTFERNFRNVNADQSATQFPDREHWLTGAVEDRTDAKMAAMQDAIDKTKALMAAAKSHWTWAESLSDPTVMFPELTRKSITEIRAERAARGVARAQERADAFNETRAQQQAWDLNMNKAIDMASPKLR